MAPENGFWIRELGSHGSLPASRRLPLGFYQFPLYGEAEFIDCVRRVRVGCSLFANAIGCSSTWRLMNHY